MFASFVLVARVLFVLIVLVLFLRRWDVLGSVGMNWYELELAGS